MIQPCGDGTIIIGLTQETFFQELTRREADIRSDLNRASAAAKQLLQRELQASTAQKNDVQAAYQRTVEALRQLRLRLKDFEGDRSLADQQIRRQHAAKHHERAALLNPTFDMIAKAAVLSCYVGNFQKAACLAKDLVDAARRVSGERHENTATALSNVGGLLEVRGRYRQAEPCYRQALEIGHDVLGARHPEYAVWPNNLANLMVATGRLEEAQGLYTEASEIRRETLGERHPEYAQTSSDLAALLRVTG